MNGLLTYTENEAAPFSLKTREVTGRRILGNAAENIVGVFDKGNIAVITAKSVECFADIAIKSLIRGGYFVRKVVTDDCDTVEAAAEEVLRLDECVRFLVGVGAGKIADVARYSASKREIGYALIPTAPSTESYICDYVAHTGNGCCLKCDFPEMIIIDEELMEKAPSALVAAGYGRVIAQLVGIFDLEFSKVVDAADFNEDILQDLAENIHRFELAKSEPLFKIRLMQLLMKIAKAKAAMDIKNTAVDSFAYVLAENTKGHTEGETSFIAGYVLLNLYRMFLSARAVDTLLPSDTVKTLKLLEKMRAINYNKYVSMICQDSVNAYLKRGFILNEYREELYSRLDGLDMSGLTRFWRRLYDDAGFWLKDFIGNASLMRYLSLAAELSENCLLKYIKRLGFLERFI